MTDNRYLKNRDMRRGVPGSGRRDGHYARYKEFLARAGRPMPPEMAKHESEYDYGYPKGDYRRDMKGDMEGYGQDSRNDYRGDYGREYYIQSQDYARDMRDMRDMGGSDKEFKEDLHRWTMKLKHKDRFGIKKEEILTHAKNMGVKFDEFSEEEFYVVYLMMVSDYKSVGDDFRKYISLAKEWLMDDDVEVTPSEKLCIYFYEIVKGEGSK